MFNIFKKKMQGEVIKLKLSGLHCTACSLTIDDELESIPGVISASTNYARQESVINYEPTKVEPTLFRSTIEKLGYKVL